MRIVTLPLAFEARFHRSAVGVDAAHARADAAQVGQRHHQPDGAVAAHAEEADVVEEDHAGLARGVVRLAEQRAHDGVVAARLVDDGRADVVEVVAEAVEALLDRAAAEIGAARDDDARGLAAGVGIDYVDAYSYRAKC